MNPKGFSGALNSWLSMMRRCLDPLDGSYRRYGGRGIVVCERWYDWRNFYADMGDRPEALSLDRIDNDGPYSPDNCRWATRVEQMRNTSRNVRVLLDGVEMLQTDAARLLGLSQGTVCRRVRAGFAPGERRGMRLTRTEALAIRARAKYPHLDGVLANKYGVSRQAVSQIRLGVTWREPKPTLVDDFDHDGGTP